MNEKVTRLKTPEDCEQFARNVEKMHPDLALAARRRAVELRAESHKVEQEAERAAMQALYAYEAVLTAKNGKKTRATRTWQAVKSYGLMGAIERAVNRPPEPTGLETLKRMGMEDLAFERVVLRYPDLFSFKTIERARGRIGTTTS